MTNLLQTTFNSMVLTSMSRDLDQIKADLTSSKHLSQFKDTKAFEDLPGLGRYYCVECSRWFEAESTLVAHKRAKTHKRRFVPKFRGA